MKRLLLILPLLTSCAKDVWYIDEAVLPYVQHWERTVGRKVKSSVKFKEHSGNIAGVCYEDPLHHNMVQIDTYTWKRKLSEKQKLILIFHELGHCELNLSHNKKILDDGCPETYMYPYILSNYCIDKRYGLL